MYPIPLEQLSKSWTSSWVRGFKLLRPRTDPLAEVEERRKPGPKLGKRKASGSPSIEEEEESGLQCAVKKLIRQAQLEVDSPAQSAYSTSASAAPSPQTDMRIFSDTSRDRTVFDA